MRIVETQDGSHTLITTDDGVSYHSRYGAIQESRHVFINAGLNFKAIGAESLSILEMGFGAGLNAFISYLETVERAIKISYTGIDNLPLTDEVAAKLNYPQLLNATAHKDVFIKMHSLGWNKQHLLTDRFSFSKFLIDFVDVNFQNQFDVIYFDAFAPNFTLQPWEEPVLQKMFLALKSQGILVTYCAKGSFKRNLKSVGFNVESLDGPPGKREMVRARKQF